MFIRKLTGSKEYKSEKKVKAWKLIVQLALILMNAFWMWHTWKLIQIDSELADHSFNPYQHLGLSMPMDARSGLNSPEVKKAYRGLARKYHPDKVRQLPEEEQGGATKKWQDIVKAYECLTSLEKMNNWMEFGNPDGSVVARSFDIALPSWVSDPENSVTVLVLLFGLCVVAPIVIIASTLDNNPANLRRYENGIDAESGTYMLKPLFEILEKNMKKKVKTLTDD